MFRWIEGTVIDKGQNDIIVSSGGIGYRVFCSPATNNSFHVSKPAKLWLYTSVRENAIDIYGFLNKEELNFFELLLSVNGIGPKSAITILSTASLETINDGLMSGDSVYFSKITGIGKKTAEKIMLGLKDKIEDGIGGEFAAGQKDKFGRSKNSGAVFAIEALVSLGYSERDARDAIKKVGKEISDTQAIVKAALKNLGN